MDKLNEELNELRKTRDSIECVSNNKTKRWVYYDNKMISVKNKIAKITRKNRLSRERELNKNFKFRKFTLDKIITKKLKVWLEECYTTTRYIVKAKSELEARLMAFVNSERKVWMNSEEVTCKIEDFGEEVEISKILHICEEGYREPYDW